MTEQTLEDTELEALQEMESNDTPKKPAPAVKKLIDPEQLKADASFSDVNLDDELHRQASLRAYYGTQLARAEYQVDNLKLRMGVIESKLDQKVRDEAASEGNKITEAMISKAIARNPEYVRVQMQINEAKMIAKIAKEGTEAINQRKDMLVQVAVDRREGMKGEVRVRTQQAAEEDFEARKRRAVEATKKS